VQILRANCACHHGCGGPWGSTFYEGVTHHGGFNDWAEANSIVVIYPAMALWGVTGQSHAGLLGWLCPDGIAGLRGLQSGAQISVVRNSIRGVAGS
jgi:hypothetical protein